MEKGAISQNRQPLEAEKARKNILLQSLQKKCSLVHTLIWAPLRSILDFWTPELYYNKSVIFKPLNLW